MNIRLLPTLLAAASLLLAGCLPESKNPLSTPQTSRIDVDLEGVYLPGNLRPDDSSLSTMHFHYRAKRVDGLIQHTNVLDMLEITHEVDSGLITHAYRLLTTRIGDQNYMSFQDLGKSGVHATTYTFARYEIGWRGTLRVWLINSEAVAEAIHAGKLHGTVKPVKYQSQYPEIMITDSTEQLAAFVKASDPKKLFAGKPMVLKRITP
ncbi:MAG TPA: hypothetical protein VK961_07530 [Chthoniobacter sp.]|nr:hypothetical protein [Chthoniobacter sp.]